VLNESMLLRFPAHEISFFIAPNEPRSHALESLRGQRGWLLAKKLSLIAIDQEDTILLMGLTDQGQILEDESRSLRQDLNKLEREIEDAARASRQAPTMPTKLDWQRRKRLLEDRRDTAEKAYEAAKQEVRHQKDLRLEEIGTQLEQQSQEQTLFAFRWFLA